MPRGKQVWKPLSGEHPMNARCACREQSTDGGSESLASLKEGPVHDVAWSPTGSHFMVVVGFMPAKTILFDAK